MWQGDGKGMEGNREFQSDFKWNYMGLMAGARLQVIQWIIKTEVFLFLVLSELPGSWAKAEAGLVLR